jgi:glycine/D-amino acid oxidase-like deaminating enzyme
MNRRVNALRHAGVDSELLDPAQIRRLLPLLREQSDAGRRLFGGFIQRRGGVVRHDAVAWGYARAANALGVDIIQDRSGAPLVLEVNSMPAWQGLQRVTRTRIADSIVAPFLDACLGATEQSSAPRGQEGA